MNLHEPADAFLYLCKGVIMKTCLYKMDAPSKLPPSTRMRVTLTDGVSGWLFVPFVVSILESMRIEFNNMCMCK